MRITERELSQAWTRDLERLARSMGLELPRPGPRYRAALKGIILAWLDHEELEATRAAIGQSTPEEPR